MNIEQLFKTYERMIVRNINLYQRKQFIDNIAISHEKNRLCNFKGNFYTLKQHDMQNQDRQ